MVADGGGRGSMRGKVPARIGRAAAGALVLIAVFCAGQVYLTSGDAGGSEFGSSAPQPAQPPPTSQLLRQDVIVNADLWDEEPRMMAAGLGFTTIIGIPGLSLDDLTGSEALVRAAGGAWNTLHCADDQTPALVNYTSAVTPQAVAGT